jgi:two-component system sensor histidine kinase UhpB
MTSGAMVGAIPRDSRSPVIPTLSDAQGRDLQLIERILGVPLLGKLLGANALLVVAWIAAHFLFSTSTALELGVLLVLSFAVNALLAWLALRPLAELERTAARVSEGNFGARVPSSRLADRDIRQLSDTLNRLLTRVESDRARIEYLAGRSVRARDVERQAIARELRESLAQSVSAVALQVAAAERSNTDPECKRQLQITHGLIAQITDDMRSVAETLYPGTLDELGLVNALKALARRAERRGKDLRVKIEAATTPMLSAPVAAALYRVADEAVRNVTQHADARHARIVVRMDGGDVVLEVEDDGRGLDMRRTDPLQAGLGLFSARAVLALAGGRLQVSSGPDLGTSVVARVPFSASTQVQ